MHCYTDIDLLKALLLIHSMWQDSRQEAIIHNEGPELACFPLLVCELKLTSLDFPTAMIIILFNHSYYLLWPFYSLPCCQAEEHFFISMNECCEWSKEEATVFLVLKIHVHLQRVFWGRDFHFYHQMNLSRREKLCMNSSRFVLIFTMHTAEV